MSATGHVVRARPTAGSDRGKRDLSLFVRPHLQATPRLYASSASLGALRPHVFASLLRSTGKCQSHSVIGVWLHALWWASSAVRALQAFVEVSEATTKHDGTPQDLPSSTLEPHLEGQSAGRALAYLFTSRELALRKLITRMPSGVSAKQTTCTRSPSRPRATYRVSGYSLRSSTANRADSNSKLSTCSKEGLRSRLLRSFLAGSKVMRTHQIVRTNSEKRASVVGVAG